MARLYGRLQAGLTPWRQRRLRGAAFPGLRSMTIWSTRWRSPEEWIALVETPLLAAGAAVKRGGEFDPWELEVWGGPLGAVRARMVIEEHGRGNQLVRIRIWPQLMWLGAVITLLSTGFAACALYDYAWTAAAILGATGLLLWLAALDEWSIATSVLLRVLRSMKTAHERGPTLAPEVEEVGLIAAPAPNINP
jgi:O-antigen biosynthesis protein